MTNKKLVTILILTIALLIAFITRFYMLGKAPAGLYLDEAGQGYSAYSILKTGKDEFGKSFPIVFRSFTDFKTPVYVYLIVPLIPIFGLTAFTVRFPSFFFSILTFPVLYLLIKELGEKLEKKEKIQVWLVSLISVTLLSISPWHILFGRTNFECNVALFFLLTGCLLFYKSFKKPWILIFAAIFFGIAIPAYHAQRVVTPLMLIALSIRHRRILMDKAHIKFVIIAAVLGLTISLPTLSVAWTPGFLARASGLNIFSTKTHESAGYLSDYHGILSGIVNNHIFLSFQEFGSLYTSYFSPRNMFLLGDSGPRSSFPELATFFVWQSPFYIYGLYLIVKRKELGEFRFFTLAFLFIAPIPAALTRDPYSTIRSLQMVIPLTIIISLAITETYQKIKKYKIIFWLCFAVLILYSLLKLYSSVIILNEFYRAKYWNYGWEEATNVIKSLKPQIGGIIVDNSRDEPYIQLAFFLKYDPTKFQKENFEVSPQEYYTNMDRNKDKNIGKIATHPIDWEHDLNEKRYIVGDELAISLQQIKEHNLTLIKEIKYPDGTVALRIVETNPKLASH